MQESNNSINNIGFQESFTEAKKRRIKEIYKRQDSKVYNVNTKIISNDNFLYKLFAPIYKPNVKKISIIVLSIIVVLVSYGAGRVGLQSSFDQKYNKLLSQNKDLQAKMSIKEVDTSGYNNNPIYPGVSKPDQTGQCSDNYPLKAKVDQNNPRIYNTDDKSYKKVTAHLCFSSEVYFNEFFNK